MGGLGIADQVNIEGIDAPSSLEATTAIPSIDINPGWDGKGLQGNRSFGSLERSLSAASGLFIEGEGPVIEQVAGEQTVHASTSTNSLDSGNKGYIKTTNMASLYYRRAQNNAPSSSNPNLRGQAHDDNHKEVRRKSKSHADLSSSIGQL